MVLAKKSTILAKANIKIIYFNPAKADEIFYY